MSHAQMPQQPGPDMQQDPSMPPPPKDAPPGSWVTKGPDGKPRLNVIKHTIVGMPAQPRMQQHMQQPMQHPLQQTMHQPMPSMMPRQMPMG